MEYFDLISKYNKVIFFYLLVIMSSSFFAHLSYRYKKGVLIWNKVWFVLSFAILFLFLGFNSYSIDYENYAYIFERSTSFQYFISSPIEKGYLLFNCIIRFFTDSFYVFHIIWAFVILVLYYSTIAEYRSVLNPGYCILAYTCIYLIQSLALMRLYLAIAIVFWGVRFVFKRKYFSFCLVIITAMFFHKSAICLFFPAALIIASEKRGHFISKILFCIVFFVLIYSFQNFLFGDIFYGYAYGLRKTDGFGFAPIAYAIPIGALLYYVKKKYPQRVSNDYIVTELFVFSVCALTLSMMRYFIVMISRAVFYFTYVTIVFPSYLLSIDYEERYKKNEFSKGLNHNTHGHIIMDSRFFLNVFFIMYFLFRAFMMISYIESDGLNVYFSLFGFSI